MYSDVLDELSVYDTNYNIQDHLPRVHIINTEKLFLLAFIASVYSFSVLHLLQNIELRTLRKQDR
jgi:hypothetical protein